MALLDPARLILLATGAATALLSILLLWLDINKRANRAFAALLALKGLSILLVQVPILFGASLTLFTFRVLPYVFIPIIPVALYFASVFPRQRGPLGRPGGGWITLILVIVLEGAYFARHSLFWIVQAGTPTHPALGAGAGYAITSMGPLSLLLWGSFAAFGFLALLFLRDYTRAAEGAQRFSHFLVGAGFALNALFDGSRQIAGFTSILADLDSYPLAPWGWGAAFLPSLALIPATAALVLVAVHRIGTVQERRIETRFFIASALAVLTGLAPFFLPAEKGFFNGPVLIVLLTLWRLALPVLVSYALLRYALFDIDVRIQRTIRRGTVAAMFGAVYFIISEGVESLVSNASGPWFGLGAAALLTIAIKPVQAAASKVATRAMPDAVPARAMTGDRIALYTQHCAMVLEDGEMTNKERSLLDALAATWGLTKEQTKAVESQVWQQTRRTGPTAASA